MNRLVKLLILICFGFLIAPELVWFYTMVTTDPPAIYMVKSMEEQIGCLDRSGIAIKPPTIRVIRGEYHPGTPHGFAYMSARINIILLVSFASYETIAHELGHIVDVQTRRKGHLIHGHMKDLSDQAFADAIKHIILKECNGGSPG